MADRKIAGASDPRRGGTSRAAPPWLLGAILLALAVLGLAAGALTGCDGDGSRGGFGEAMEELGDEAEDAAEEIEDEVDDRT